MVEYVGETVRRSVVGLREAREYDARCGAGTYVFGMSASSGLCTDATSVRLLALLEEHKRIILQSIPRCGAGICVFGMPPRACGPV